MIGIGLGITTAQFLTGGSGAMPGGYRWIVDGTWDDASMMSVPATAALEWLILGTWDDAAFMDVQPGWAQPDGSPYAIWDDGGISA